MADGKLLTIRDVSIILNISEREVIDLAESGKIPAYKIAGVYLRFKREQIEEFRKSSEHFSQRPSALSKYPLSERISDFLYFNDFYMVAVLIMALLLLLIFRGY